MAAFAIVSFFQMVFIPGFIFLKFFKLKNTGILGTIIYSFSLSLLINYLLVYHLALIGIYTPLSAYLILTIELILIIILFLKQKLKIKESLYLELPSNIRSFPENLIPLISAAAILGSLYFFFSSYGDVFTHWDAVFSWNRWAIDWYLNDIPGLTYLYPQLIPANWSLSYIMMQDSSLQFAARSIMSLFAIYISITLFDLYLKKKSISSALSVIIFSTFVFLYSLPYISSGYVDFAAAFLSMAAFHAILMTDTSAPDNKNILMVFLLAASAAAAKQAGFIILVFAIIWFIWLMVRNRKLLYIKNILKYTALVFFIIVFCLYWYIVKSVDIAMGRDFSTLKFLLVDIHHDAGMFNRFLKGLELLRASPVFLLVIFGISLISLFNRKSRWFTLGITLPSFLIWGFFFSYDDRNIIMTFPFMAWSASSGLVFLLKKVRTAAFLKYLSSRYPRVFRKRPGIKIKLWPKHVFFLICFSIILGIIFLAGALGGPIKARQVEKQQHIGDSSLNQLLYDYLENEKIDGKIITDYYWATALPGFEGSNTGIFLENDRFIILSNSDSYELIDPNTLVDKDTFGFLISDMYFRDEAFKDNFMLKIESGEYTLLFSSGGYHFIRINK